MRVLQVNKFYHILGGTGRYFFDISSLLQKKGHQVAPFAMSHELNEKTKWSAYFTTSLSFASQSKLELLSNFIKAVYNKEARFKIRKLLNSFKPDIIHAHSVYHHLSPAILPEIKRKNIPIVQTIGDYHLIAPNYNLFHNKQICEITKANKFYKAVFHKCVKDSYLASLAEIIEKYIHYTLGWERNDVDCFIAPSQFMRSKLVEYGIDKRKIVYLSHFVDYIKYSPNYTPGNYILYFGRLSSEKGLDCLLDVMSYLPSIKLKIAGKGQEEIRLKQRVKKLKLSNVEFLGFLEGKYLRRVICNCRFTVLPSLWYEVFGLSILESYASGKPVVASYIGGIPEIVKDGYTGFLVKPGNKDDLIKKINYLWNKPKKVAQMGKNARKFAMVHFGADKHYKKLMEVYSRTRKVNR